MLPFLCHDHDQNFALSFWVPHFPFLNFLSLLGKIHALSWGLFQFIFQSSLHHHHPLCNWCLHLSFQLFSLVLDYLWAFCYHPLDLRLWPIVLFVWISWRFSQSSFADEHFSTMTFIEFCRPLKIAFIAFISNYFDSELPVVNEFHTLNLWATKNDSIICHHAS